MQRRTQMNLQLQQQWRHDGETPKQAKLSRRKTRAPRQSDKRALSRARS